MNEVLVTIDTGALRNSAIARFDLYGVSVSTECERNRMEKAVVCFSQPFTNGVVWQMTIVAHGDVVVTALLP